MPVGQYSRKPRGRYCKRVAVSVIGPSISYVPLTQGFFACIDSGDAEFLSQYSWNARKKSGYDTRYAVTSVYDGPNRQRTVTMHGMLVGYENGLTPDHIDPKRTLDNRRANLRAATSSQQECNRPLQRNNTSGYKGVHKFSEGKWLAHIHFERKYYYLGLHSTPELAHEAVTQMRARLHGDFARVA